MRRLPMLAVLFVTYLVSAKVGLSFAAVHPSATAIWPPTGIALAACLLIGRDVWPAIFAAAFIANLTTAGSVLTAMAIAAGNTLESMAGASLVERSAGGKHAFDRPPDIFRFVVLAGLFSTMISPTIGVTSLSLAGYAQWTAFGSIWLTWWLGDATGALLVAPLLLVWRNNPVLRWDRQQLIEALLVLGALIASSVTVFGDLYPPTRSYPLAFVCIPPLVWTAFRFGQRETATAVLIVLGIATWGTLDATGPFAPTPPFARLLILQAFMGTIAAMVMSIAALVTEQRRLLAAEQHARAEAETASRAKDAFLAMLGHELRNPLAAITTGVHVLDRVATLDGKAARVREIIVGQVSHLTRLVDDLLDVTRVTAGKITLRRRRLDLSALVSESLNSMMATGEAKAFTIEFLGQPVWVDVDETRVQQMLVNLMTNAFKYTPRGGVIRVTVDAEGDHAILRVTDTGMGITQELLPRIFDLFTQGDRSPDRSQGGLGIGLTIVKRLAELHGGSVEAASEGPGRGSTFTIRFAGAPARRSVDETARAPTQVNRRRVLVAEDQADAREMLLVALESAGHEVFQAADGLDAIETASKCLPEVAVVDIGLPRCDGYEVARRIRLMPDGQGVYLIALTGYGQPEDRRLAEEAGFDLHVVKPIDPDRLNALIAEGLKPHPVPGLPS